MSIGGATSDRGMSAVQAAKQPGRLRRGVLYPDHYAWYILAATLDVIVTHQVLHQFQGSEVNKLADSLIREFGVAGMVGLKFASIVIVVLICEFVGRRNLRLGRRVAVLAICISATPVGIGLLQIWAWSHSPQPTLLIDPNTGEAIDAG
jgi:hypothetical protein